jgi:hypothetical protein
LKLLEQAKKELWILLYELIACPNSWLN